MRLTVLGAGPAYTDRQDATGAAYLISHEGTNLLLDLGQGAFPRIFPHVHPTSLDAIVVSHLHPDHFIDLVPLRHYLRYEFEPPRRARVIGPIALADRLDALHDEPGFTAEALDTEQLGLEGRQIGSLTLETCLVTHTDESYAMRVSTGDGPGLVYSGDCGRAERSGAAHPARRHAPDRGGLRRGTGAAGRPAPRRPRDRASRRRDRPRPHPPDARAVGRATSRRRSRRSRPHGTGRSSSSGRGRSSTCRAPDMIRPGCGDHTPAGAALGDSGGYWRRTPGTRAGAREVVAGTRSRSARRRAPATDQRPVRVSFRRCI